MTTIDVTKDTKAMMPLWQKRLIMLLAIVLAFLALLAFFFRGNLFKELIKPKIPFQIAQKPPAPNYNDANAWVKRPQTLDNNSIAVFFISPTTYYNGKSGWNADVETPKILERLSKSIIPNHATPFDNGNLWIPKYRQATLYSMLSQNEDAHDALTLAYSDVEAAFDNFINARPPNSKYIIVGINQGGLHALRLLQSKIANQNLENSLVAAYIIDQAVPEAYFTPKNGATLGNISICHSSTQKHCMISFANFDENDKKSQINFLQHTTIWQPSSGYNKLSGQMPVCTNPLNGGSANSAKSIENLGSVSANNLETGVSPALLPGVTGANCIGGILITDSQRPANLRHKLFELGAKLKTPDYNLFYKALQNDVRNRSK